VLKICGAAIPMALIAWLANEFAGALPLQGLLLKIIRVVTAIALATLTFYLSCHLLRIEELNEAITAIAGKLRRTTRQS
jgi:uncharacterized membrane protein YfbV (UPF0208 family)